MRDAVAATYRGRINLVTVEPAQTVAEQDADDGRDLFATATPTAAARCARSRRWTRALAATTPGPAACAATSRSPASTTRSSTGTRATARSRSTRSRAGPRTDVDAYIEKNDVLVNTLLMDGFASIGCFPCTRRVSDGEDARDGRWAGTGKSECGIHLVARPDGAPSLPALPRRRRPPGRRRRRRPGRGPPRAALVDAGAHVVVVAPWRVRGPADLVAAGRVTWQARDYVSGDLDGAWLVHTATGDRGDRRPGRRRRRGGGSGASGPTTRLAPRPGRPP